MGLKQPYRSHDRPKCFSGWGNFTHFQSRLINSPKVEQFTTADWRCESRPAHYRAVCSKVRRLSDKKHYIAAITGNAAQHRWLYRRCFSLFLYEVDMLIIYLLLCTKFIQFVLSLNNGDTASQIVAVLGFFVALYLYENSESE